MSESESGLTCCGRHETTQLPAEEAWAIARATFLTEHRRGSHTALAARAVLSTADVRSLIPAGFTVLLTQQQGEGRVLVAAALRSRLILEANDGRLRIGVTAADERAAAAVLDAVEGGLPPTRETASPSLLMRFWAHGPQGASMTARKLAAESWTHIDRNYPRPTRQAVHRVMQVRSPSSSSRLLLWHGPPGTGKTTAIRTLAYEWAPWCDPHYITDPEELFGNPLYLLEVAGCHESASAHLATQVDDRWNLVIAEDCDEYLRADARQRAGASLNRLLNLSDGILGQGLRCLILLTTNEPIGRLHPALTRPGRCLASVRFDPFDAAEATRWLGRPVDRPEVSLAELYALRAGGTIDLESNETGIHSAGVGHYL